MRKTKIICTIGPASDSEEMLEALMLAGMNVARFNFSHGTHEQHKEKLETMKKVREKLGLPVAALLDTKGPEIRLKDFENGEIELASGQTFALTTEEISGTQNRVTITYKNLLNDVKTGGTILIDDGLISMTIEEITATDIICKVENGGPVSNHKGVNVPNTELTMPYLSETDKSDILFGIENNYDFIAASFVRNKDDIDNIRAILKEHGSNMKIIAKIENSQGIKNIDEILEASDGLMVARGDMGVEVPIEEVPVIQKKMIKKAVSKGKHVVTATQMLDSMMHNPRPTRAEATDVANAIYDGTTAIMLSGETASGLYPLEALKTMVRIAKRAEDDIKYAQRFKHHSDIKKSDVATAVSHATCTTAIELSAKAIVTVTLSGFTASMITRFKPSCNIIAATVDEQAYRQLNLMWGVVPMLMENETEENKLFNEVIKRAEKSEHISKGDTVVVTAGLPLGISGKTNMMRVMTV